MKKIITLLILSITFIQNSPLFGMFFKKSPTKLHKKNLNKMKLCSNKTAEFNYDTLLFNAMQQIKSLKEDNRSLKLTIELLLLEQKDDDALHHTQKTIRFVSKDKRSSGEKE